MDSKELTKIIYSALDDKKGENIKILDISKVSVIADYFVIANGSNINLSYRRSINSLVF